MTMFSSQWFASPGVDAGYEVANSCRFNSADSSYLIRTSGDAGTPKTWTIFMYCKRGVLGTLQQLMTVDNGSDTNTVMFQFNTDDKLRLYFLDTSAALTIDWKSTRVFRDPNAWYFFTFTMNTVPSTPIFKVWNWNTEITAWDKSTADSLAQDDVFEIGTSGARYEIGDFENGTGRFFDGYLAQCGYMDGTVVTSPSDGSLIELDSNGVYRPLNVSGLDFGTAGHFLDFADDSDLGNDVSGNNNDFTSSGLADVDQMTDTPTNNYSTLSSIGLTPAGSSFGLGDGNLYALPTTTSWLLYRGSQMITSGKWIFEATWTGTLASSAYIGFLRDDHPYTVSDARSVLGLPAKSHVWDDAQTRYDLNSYTTGQGATWTGGDVITCELDYSAQTIKWYKDGGSVETTSTGISNTHGFIPCIGLYGNSSRTVTLNFGQASYTKTPSTDHIDICTTNLAVPSIADPSAHFQSNARTGDGAGATADVNGATSSTTTLVVDGNSGTIAAGMYVTGTGVSGSVTVASLSDQNNLVLSSAQSLSDGVGLTFSSAVTQTGNSQFGTDLIIIKNMDQTDEWKVVDTGRGATYEINTDAATAQTQDTNGVTAFSATDGYMIGTGAGGYNDNTEDFMDYHFQEGSTPGMGINASVSHEQGSETEIAHGMGLVPAFAMLKETDAATSWWVFHQDLTSKTANYLILDTAVTQQSITDVWGTQTSTNFVIGDAAGGLADGTYVCYSFAEVAGFSTFGSYTGNGDADGTLISLTHNIGGLLVKKMTNASNNWTMMSPEQNPIGNPAVNHLRMDTTDAAQSSADSQDVDLLSNGFKIRNGANQLNTSGSTYVFAAWAKNPFGGHGGTFGTGVAPATAI